MHALRYFFEEALASLRRGYKTGVVAIATIAAVLFVLGGFLLLTSNLEGLLARWQNAAEFSVYLRDDVTAEQQAVIEQTLRASGLVAELESVSKGEALERFKDTFGELATAVESLPTNPLPASVEVRMAAGAPQPQVQALAIRTGTAPGVADVRYDRQWIERLATALGLLRVGGLALATVLILAAALTVASVVRLALLARRDEIEIMQLVGAPLAYIRGPFVVEGLVEGGVGALLALALLWGSFWFARARFGPVIAEAVDPASLAFLSLPTCVSLLTGGMAVGCAGGLVAARSARESLD